MSVNKVDKTTGNISLLAGSTLWADSPIGSILPYGGASAPSGWFLCQGQTVSRTTYSELFAVIGTSFGAGDGSTTFNIPDLRGEFLRGAGANSHTNQGNGGNVGTHQDATEFPNLYGKNSSPQFGYVATDANYAFEQITKSDAEIKTGNTKYSLITTDAFGNTTATDRYTSRPTNTSVNYIIKAKMVAMPSDFMSKVDEVVDELHVETYTLLSTTITETHTDYTLDSNRKLSDYDYLALYQFDSTSLRNSITFYLNDFKTKRVILSALHGTNVASASDYSVSTVNVGYIDDTTINAYSTGSAVINAIKLVGVKIKMR